MIYILIVWRNEELNLPDCLGWISLLSDLIPTQLFYLDQKSDDRSKDLMMEAWATIYDRDIRYIEPDRKRAVEHLMDPDERVLILDCDEIITPDLAKEIAEIVRNNDNTIWRIKRKNYFLGIVRSATYERRLFKPSMVHMTDIIHQWVSPKKWVQVKKTTAALINDDKKLHGSEIQSIIKKRSHYTRIDADRRVHYPTRKAILSLICMPRVWFLWYLFWHRNILKWYRGWINALLMWWYQFMVYAQVLEQHYHRSHCSTHD